MASQTSVNELLEAARGGNATARDELIVVVYDELRRLAGAYLQQERPGHTLQPTALVHEAYLRLVGQSEVLWQNREHFIGVAATMMRRVLLNHARARGREKRGGGRSLALADAERLTGGEDVELLELEEALGRLARVYPDEARIVELRFFGGLSIQETAAVLGVSHATVERDWKFARIWLMREMGGGEG